MKKILLLIVFIFSSGLSFAQNASWKLWDKNKEVAPEKIRQTTYSENQNLLQFDADQFKQSLVNIPEKASGQEGVEIQFPNINGKLERFVVWESSNFAPELQAQYPQIRAYIGKGITDPSASLSFSFSPKGIKTMVFRPGVGTEFIEPYTKDRSVYVIFDSGTRIKGELPFKCGTEDFGMAQEISNRSGNTNVTQASSQSYKTMRLALSCTAEYTTYHGGATNALAAMNETMSRCNPIFERDLAIKLLIIANNSTIIYTNAATDPYDNALRGTGNDPANNYTPTWNAQLQAALNAQIGAANYDIGHLFGAAGGGGNAGCIGCVCVDANKGSGFTSPMNEMPEGDLFDIDYVAHEMGHQMGALHIFSHGGVTGMEDTNVNVEPGSGSTIMGYAGIGENGTDMQASSDDYFGFKSISQIQSNMGGKTCPISVNMATTNPRPTVAVAGPVFSIPISTAFKLSGTGGGTAGEVLTYCWEQDNDATIIGPAASLPSPTKTDGPNFRSRIPSLSPVRYMPQFSDVLAGNLAPTWEKLSSVARSLRFAFTVRDNVLNGGQTMTGVTTVSVVNTGAAFAITSPSTANTSWDPGATTTITWNVAGTTANGINTANVNILLSTDGGATFPTVLAANTANDGSQEVTIPNTTSPNCRILIEAVGNIFYAVSKNIAIGYVYTNTCVTYTNNSTLNIPDGAGNNVAGPTVSKILNIPDSGTISDVNVTLAGAHTYFWHLNIGLKHPDGTQSRLLYRNCNQSTTGFNILFSDGSPAITCSANVAGTFRPSTALSVFNGKDMVGDWTLSATDYYTGNTGSVGDWSIEICGLLPQLTAVENQFTDFVIYPNPSRGNFNVQFENHSSNEIKVNVFDMRGRVIFENKYSNQATFNENIQLSNAQSGIYLVTVTDGNQKLTKRLVIE